MKRCSGAQTGGKAWVERGVLCRAPGCGLLWEVEGLRGPTLLAVFLPLFLNLDSKCMGRG